MVIFVFKFEKQPFMLPKLKLANLPTRIEKLNRISAELGVNMYIKRDDQTGSEVSENKIRKLEYIYI